jgi:hypothetical protein
MATALPDWTREFYHQPGGAPYLFFAVYGAFGKLPNLSAAQYRSAGIPDGLKFKQYSRQEHPQVLARFQEGYVWEDLQRGNRELARQIAAAPQCVILRGQVEDSDKLNYLRDAVGLVTFLLDQGGIVVYDPFLLHWWPADEWRRRIFEPAGPVPTHHVVLLTTDEETPGRTWFHTRGLVKFGRPDLSIRNVPPQLHQAVTELCNRFIFFQALGGTIEEGQKVTMKGLPDGLTCRHQGDMEDPNFNNVHVEVVVP